jgi:Flp pilus assembly pilin Flp
MCCARDARNAEYESGRKQREPQLIGVLRMCNLPRVANGTHPVLRRGITSPLPCCRCNNQLGEGGEITVTFTDLVHYVRARFDVEKGQTMAEYGVVLAVLALGVVVALGLLSGAISGAIDKVRGIL